jgi:hypothetical protein
MDDRELLPIAGCPLEFRAECFNTVKIRIIFTMKTKDRLHVKTFPATVRASYMRLTEYFAYPSPTKMKMHARPPVKAHVLRGAFYLLLFLTMFAIPFALAQHNSTRQIARSVKTVPLRSAFYPHAGCQFHVLIVYADSIGLPTQLEAEILAEPSVIGVDLFDASIGTPTVAELQQYDIIVPFSNDAFLDADTLGNNLADYVDGGGIVVQYGFSFYAPCCYGVNGRWLNQGYSPFVYTAALWEGGPLTLGAHNAAHPLMAGVTTLNSDLANVPVLAAGATEVAQWNGGGHLAAFRPVSNGHTTIGVSAYVGAEAAQSGDWGKVIVNAGNWLRVCGASPTPTVTPTPTATTTPNPTLTPCTGRCAPTPRPRPTPATRL